MHLVIDDATEKGLAVMGDDGDEIAARGGVVVVLKADGAAVVGRIHIYNH